tara:strand:+ start:2249 stop:2764 length:516 start_codon:yes stop_codon:yes gene_type:complete
MIPPFVATLLAQGLGLLGNAVLAKGKEAIEDKLGVDLEALTQTPEGLQQLRQMELDHEEFLLTNALEARKLDIANTQGARDSNTRIQESVQASWAAKNFPYVLDGIIVSATVGLAALLFFHAIPAENKELAYAAFGSLVTMCGTILNYHRGSSSGSKEKTDSLARMAGGMK